MKELFGENPSEMLNLLVDGELSSVQESNLYSQLAINEDLRTEFRELIAIREAVKMDSEAFTPPIESLSNILSSLSLGNISSNVGKPLIKSKSMFRRYWITAVAVLITALLTTFLVSNFYEMKYSSNSNIPIVSSLSLDDNDIVTQEPIYLDNNETRQNHNTQKNYDKNQRISKNNKTQVLNNESIQNNLLVSYDNKSDHNIADQNKINAINDLNSQELNISKINNFNKINFYTFDNNEYFNIIPLQSKPNTKKSNNIGYSVHLRGLTSQSFPNIDMPSQSKTFLNNIAFAGFLSAGVHHKLGFELGQEPFGQRFTNLENNFPNEYEQNPILFWAGLSYRYEFDRLDFLGGFQPFGQITVGSTELGPLGRTILGLQYFNESGVGFSLGIEGVLLLYENQKVIYNTKKLGLTYGMFFNF